MKACNGVASGFPVQGVSFRDFERMFSCIGGSPHWKRDGQPGDYHIAPLAHPICNCSLILRQSEVLGNLIFSNTVQNRFLRKYYSGSDLKSDLKHLSVKALQSASIGEADVSKPLDEALSNIPQILNKYGVSLSGELSNHLDFKNADSSILVFEGEKSLSSRGLGSQRLTSIALNLETKINKTLVLIDEIETSLEPFRIRTLISLLRDRVKDNGQIIFTTHSPITLDSCKFDEVFILQTTEEDDRLYSVGSLCDTDDLQKAFRRFNKCLLGRKIIICEGHTEFELIKAIDSYFFNRNNSSLACYGVDYIDGNGGSNSPVK
jgi:hypothetical protein